MKQDNIRRNVSLLMEHFGISSESQMAREVGLGQATIHKLISGATADPRLTTLIPIAERYKITLDTLISDNPVFDSNVEKTFERKSIHLIPLLTFEELLDVYYNLHSLHEDNWPHWTPLVKQDSQAYFAVQLSQNQLPIPFNKKAILVLKQEEHLTQNSYCMIKHNESKVISIKKTLFEDGKTWLLSLQKELPTVEYNKKEWQYLGTAQATIIDMSNGSFIQDESK